MVKLGEVNPTVWDRIADYMEFRLEDIEFQREDIEFDYRQYADSNRLEREIYAKYGRFKDIILHPTFQYYKQWFDEHVSWELVLDDGTSIVPFSVVVIILSMLYSRLSKDALLLLAGFLLNINPIYVVICMLMYWMIFYRVLKPKRYRSKTIMTVSSSTPFSAKDEHVSHLLSNPKHKIYDHILIGDDISTLYTAAILSRVGRRCLVLCPSNSPKQQCHIDDLPPIPLHNLTIGKPERYQHYFDLVQSKRDPRHRVSFGPIGSERDGYTHCSIHILPPPYISSLGQKPERGVLQDIISFRAEEGNVCSAIAAATLSYDKAAFKLFNDTIVSTLNYLHSYLITKVLGSDKITQVDTLSKTQGVTDFMNLSTHNIGDVLDRNMQDPLSHAIMHALSVYGCEEYLPPNEASGVGLAIALGSFERGLYYPGGGYDVMKRALTYAIRAAGGEIIDDVIVDHISIEDDVHHKTSSVKGIDIMLPSSPSSSSSSSTSVHIPSASVISGVGALHTYTHLVPPSHVSDDIRTKLSSLSECRPKLHVIYTIDATCVSADDLHLHSAEYVEVGSDYDSMRWLVSKHLNKELPSPSSTAGTNDHVLNHSYCRIACPSLQDHLWTAEGTLSTPRVHTIVMEFEVGDALVTLKPYRFSQPSINEASYPDATRASSFSLMSSGPKMFTSNTNSSLSSSNEIHLSKSHRDRILIIADKKLQAVYPKIFSHPDLLSSASDNMMVKKTIISPCIGGYRVTNTPAKYGCKLSSPSDIDGLYLCGRDISSAGLMGDIQGAWVAANAVLGYTAAEMIMGRNITSDLESLPVKY